MRQSRLVGAGVLLTALSGGYFASPAIATFHEWRIDELYSNPSGSVQFIEFLLPSSGIDDESHVGGQIIKDTSFNNSFTIPANLPSVPPVNGHFLVATPGYAALTGVPTADYILPSNDFFNVNGDTLDYSFVDALTFTSTQLPTDGINSLTRAYGAITFGTAGDSPTNLAGATGVVPVPEPATLGAISLAISFALRRHRKTS